jgi:hypothetical protein
MKISTTNLNWRKSFALQKLFLLLSVFGLSLSGFAQQHVLFTEGFESGSSGWTLGGIPSENQWVVGECADNGDSAPGANALYITDGSSDLCGFNFLYTISLNLSSSIIAHRTVDAFCGSNLMLQFDYRAGGNALNFAEVVYSTDGGGSWTVPSGGVVPSSATWSTMSVNLPASLENTSFLLGFRFNYTNGIPNNPSVAFDNLALLADDNEAPTMVCPVVYNLYTNALSCEQLVPDLSKVLISLSDNCTDSVNVQFNQYPGPITLSGHLDEALITLEAIDEAGNMSSCQITVVLLDTVRPVVSCPFDFEVDRNANCEYLTVNYSALISKSDNCTSIANLVYNQVPAVGTVLGSNATETVMVEYTDEAGNTGSCEFEISLVDNLPPSVTCPSTQTLQVNSSCDGLLDDYTALAVFADNCTDLANLIINQSPSPGSFVNADQVVVISVVDENFNSINCNFTVDLVDVSNPNIICPLDQTLVVTSGSCEALLPDYTGITLVSDNCAGPYTEVQTPAPGTVVAVGQVTISMVATDASNNQSSCTFTVNVVDDVDPLIGPCPADVTLFADGDCVVEYQDYTSLVTGSDNCTATQDLVFVQSPAPMDIHAGVGISEQVTITVFDESGNQASCSFFALLVDEIDPEIICGVNQTVSANADCEYILPDFTGSATATDNCTAQGAIVKAQSPVIGTVLGIGSHTITITASDASGNQDVCSFQVTSSRYTRPEYHSMCS